jgi:hypothetical protein
LRREGSLIRKPLRIHKLTTQRNRWAVIR